MMNAVPPRWPIAWGAALASVLIAAPASAFCRTTTCAPPRCPLDPVTGCPTGGVPIFWARSCVSFSLNLAASVQVDLANATADAQAAFDTWNAVQCPSGGGPIAIRAANTFGPVDCGHIEYNPTEANANVILFRDDEWPYNGAGNTLALTTVTFDGTTGEILDADMEINATLGFLTPGIKGVDDHDLLSIMVHEAGHFLGLAHSKDTEAIMQISLPARTIRTTLSDDDIAAICAVYPPGTPEPACDFTPLRGFSPMCGLNPVTGSACDVAPGPPNPAEGDRTLPVLTLLAALAVPASLRRARRLRR
jgi:hypothetical protein